MVRVTALAPGDTALLGVMRLRLASDAWHHQLVLRSQHASTANDGETQGVNRRESLRDISRRCHSQCHTPKRRPTRTGCDRRYRHQARRIFTAFHFLTITFRGAASAAAGAAAATVVLLSESAAASVLTLAALAICFFARNGAIGVSASHVSAEKNVMSFFFFGVVQQ